MFLPLDLVPSAILPFPSNPKSRPIIIGLTLIALETGFLRASVGHAEGRRQEAGGRRQKVEVTMKYFRKKTRFMRLVRKSCKNYYRYDFIAKNSLKLS